MLAKAISMIGLNDPMKPHENASRSLDPLAVRPSEVLRWCSAQDEDVEAPLHAKMADLLRLKPACFLT